MSLVADEKRVRLEDIEARMVEMEQRIQAISAGASRLQDTHRVTRAQLQQLRSISCEPAGAAAEALREGATYLAEIDRGATAAAGAVLRCDMRGEAAVEALTLAACSFMMAHGDATGLDDEAVKDAMVRVLGDAWERVSLRLAQRKAARGGSKHDDE